MHPKLFSLLFLCFLFAGCQGQTPKSVQTIDVKSFSEKLESTPNPQLLDVRTPEEFASEHIDKSKNVNWNSDSFASEAQKLDKAKPVFVYCKIGGRSTQAASKLAEMGFSEIYNLQGGILKWHAAGMSTRTEGETGEAKPGNKIIGICDQEFNELTRSAKKVIVNFYAKWCEPCRKMEPYLLKMQSELNVGAKLVRLDADQNKTILSTMKLDGLPVVLIYENGKETWRHVGFLSEDELRKHL